MLVELETIPEILEKEKYLDDFINNLNNLIKTSGERYTPDAINLFCDKRSAIIKYNYNINKYEVVVLC